MSDTGRTKLVTLMSYAEITDYLTNTPELEIEKSETKLEQLNRDISKRDIAKLKQIGDILRDVNESNLDEVLEKLERHNEIEQDWSFLERAEQERLEEIETEIAELKNIKQTPWSKTKELNDRYNMLAICALHAAQFCDKVRSVEKYKVTATKAGQLFVLTASAVEYSRKLPKEAPKHREQIKATYEEGWGLLQTLLDSGLDTVAFGYATIEQNVEHVWANTEEVHQDTSERPF